jgi:hypothetical protein
MHNSRSRGFPNAKSNKQESMVETMSDDIVTRLREKYSGQLPICLEAADEIERLRKIIRDVKVLEMCDKDDPCEMCKEPF